MSNAILINNVQTASHALVNVLIEGARFSKISNEPIQAPEGCEIVDGTGFAIIPPFYNGHCHAAMSLLRGYADDMPLQSWLNDAIWPMEAKMTAEDIEVGSRLAVLEMIKSGTVFFADMYWEELETVRVVDEMGIRAAIGLSIMDRLSDDVKDHLFELAKHPYSTDRISTTIAPHAIYTVSTDLLRKCKAVADENNLYLNVHLAETLVEDENCRKQYGGLSPVQYMNSIGLLDNKTILGHVVHVDQLDQELLAKSGAISVHNPASNMKLSSGVFKFSEMKKNGCTVVLGTDGASSNNNLDMLEEMKLAALLAKVNDNPEAGSATDIFDMSTRIAAQAFGIDAGEIKEGKLADALLVDLNNEKLVPNYNLISNLVYSADSSCVDSVICNGRFVMRNRVVPGEEEIIDRAKFICENLPKR